MVGFLELQLPDPLAFAREVSLGFLALDVNGGKLAAQRGLLGDGSLEAGAVVQPSLAFGVGDALFLGCFEAPGLGRGERRGAGGLAGGMLPFFPRLALGPRQPERLRFPRGKVTGMALLKETKHHEGGYGGDEVDFVHGGDAVITHGAGKN